MTKVVAVVAAGAMGAAVGRKLVEGGFTVLTNLEGRSEATRKRAEEAGLFDSSWKEIVERSDIILSIIPPRDSVSLAAKVLEEARTTERTNPRPLVFADCNAVNVETIKSIEELYKYSSVVFLDGCIIGGPPSGDQVPTFYASADPKDNAGLDLYEDVLRQGGIKVRILSGPGAGIGNSSALKMSYAGLSKGLTGLFTTIILASHASSPATSQALLQELSDSQPEFVRRISRSIPAMIPKAYRWVGEMEEIAGFVGDGEGDIYHGLAKIYARVEKGIQEGNGEIEILQTFADSARERI